MAKIVGIEKTLGKDGKTYTDYHFVDIADKVDGYYSGVLHSRGDSPILNPDTKEELKKDDNVTVAYGLDLGLFKTRSGTEFKRLIRSYYIKGGATTK